MRRGGEGGRVSWSAGHWVGRRAGPVLIVGDANVDLFIRLPAEGADRQPPTPNLALGGTGANTAVALRRLGQPVAMLGAIGDDGFGRFVRGQLDAAGVDLVGAAPGELEIIHLSGEIERLAAARAAE